MFFIFLMFSPSSWLSFQLHNGGVVHFFSVRVHCLFLRRRLQVVTNYVGVMNFGILIAFGKRVFSIYKCSAPSLICSRCELETDQEHIRIDVLVFLCALIYLFISSHMMPVHIEAEFRLPRAILCECENEMRQMSSSGFIKLTNS